MPTLEQEIEKLYACEPSQLNRDRGLQVFNEFKALLNKGEIRAAEKFNGQWKVNSWVKKGILLGFRLGKLVDVSIDEHFHYFDKETFPLKKLTVNDNVRVVPGGSSVRDGSYVAKGVVIMPPAYINVGAFVDDQTMIDSHALVGSCAQVGKRVHLSAASQLGGVLEPIGAMPVIIEDDVLVGGNCGIYEGTIVKRGAVIGAGVILTSSIPVYDAVKGQIYRKTLQQPLTIPKNAVVITGTRPLNSEFGKQHQLSIYSPIIIKYRDEKTDAATALEESLR